MTENSTQDALMYFYKNPTSFKKEDDSQYIDLEEVSHAYFSGVCENIFVDKNTGVLYIEDENHSLTPIYNADGSLKNISDCE